MHRVNINIVYTCQTLFVLTFLIVGALSQTENPYDKLSTYWFNKCQNQTHSTTAFDKLYADAVEFKRYLKYSFKFIPEQQKVFCNNERGNLEQRMKELTNDMRPCLAKDEKYMEDFVYTSFKEFLHFLCHNGAENMNTFFNPKANECRNKLLNGTNFDLGTCFSKLFKPSKIGQPTKQELCTDLSIVKSCFSEVLTQHCPSYGAYKKLNEEFFKYISKPCSGCAFYLNTLLLIVSLLLSYLNGR